MEWDGKRVMCACVCVFGFVVVVFCVCDERNTAKRM